MKRLVIFCSFLIIGLGVFAQSKNKQASIPDQVSLDTVRNKTSVEAESNKHSKHNKLVMKADTLTSSDYMMSIERVNDNLNSIRDSSKLGFEVVGMERRITTMTNDISLIRQNIRVKKTVINIKNLYLYQSFASNLDEENDRLQARLTKMYNRVYHAKLLLKKVLTDSIFRKLCADSALTSTFDKKLVRLEHKWTRTDSTTRANIDTINALKVIVADNSISLSNMLSMMDTRLDKTSRQLFGKEVNFLWQKAKTDSLSNDSSKMVVVMLGSEQKAIGYYFSQTSQQRTLILVLGVFLFIWLFMKRKQLKIIRQDNNLFGFLNLQYMNNHPILAMLVLLLGLMPFFDAYAPTSYIAIEFTLMLTFATIIFFKRLNRSLWFAWLVLVVLFVADALTYLLIEPTLVARLWLLAVHICIIVFSLRFNSKLSKQMPYYKAIRMAIMIGIILTALGILCNLFGRFSLSGIFGLAGISAITQAFVLSIFIETFLEIILVQLQSRRLKKELDKPFDTTIVIKKIKVPFVFIAVILWLIMLTSNLNIYNNISNTVVDVLTANRTLGSISFKLISVLFFFVIIWFAHLLQQMVSFIFGETGIETEDITAATKGQHSRLLITRLLVLIGGYLLAIAASGLPIDKLTFLIGALGVGIGMGLQNVVNNFVSGIILIFDGSLQVGDEIEVSGQAGKVKEIGLRASTLNTADGAEVIIPNGNILSQNIVNWTFSNDQKRVMIEFSLSGKELDANVINEVINGTIQQIEHVVAKRKPIILYTKVKEEGCSITVRFWTTISNAEQVKSEALLQLNTAFSGKGIKFE